MPSKRLPSMRKFGFEDRMLVIQNRSAPGGNGAERAGRLGGGHFAKSG